MHEEFFLPGEVILEQGTVVDQIYIVVHGCLVLIFSNNFYNHDSKISTIQFEGKEYMNYKKTELSCITVSSYYYCHRKRWPLEKVDQRRSSQSCCLTTSSAMFL